MTAPASDIGRRAGSRAVWIAVAVTAFAVLVLANAHLVVVAFDSQPDCVVHEKITGGDTGTFRAAKSAC
jgi:succinate dehydrogenase hydrophobic anchor subunit